MRFRQIEAFRAVMSHGSVTQAAQAINISQPAVSRLLAEFEAGLKIRLFERERGRLRPTPEAHLLFQESEMAFSGVSRLREAAASLRELRRGRVRVVSETVYAEGFIPRMAARYSSEHPGTRMEIDTGPSARIAEWIAETWYDLGMVVLPIPRVDIDVRSLRRQNALCAVPKKHPLAGQGVVRIEDLVDEPLIAPVANTPFRVIFDRALKGLDRELDIQFEVRTQHGICAFVDAGAGIGLVDPCAARDWAGNEIVFLPCAPAIHWDIALITPKARPTTLITQDFIDFLVRHTDAYFATV